MPNFQLLKKLDYDLLEFKERSVPTWVSDARCDCQEQCGEKCLNRVSRIECFEPRGPNDGGVCGVGGKCSNRAIQVCPCTSLISSHLRHPAIASRTKLCTPRRVALH